MTAGIFSRTSVIKDRKALSSRPVLMGKETLPASSVLLGTLDGLVASSALATFTLSSNAFGGPRAILARSGV
jgi:hypothetical protein